jgi:tRNA threonylcarbamoyladenosine biosynthesis protein TsaB
MKILAVDTATGRLSVAIVEDRRTLASGDVDAPGHHARHLIPLIQQVCTDASLSVERMDGLAVSIGPGSFTGLRVGLATMLAFRLIAERPLALVPTLEALAWTARDAGGILMPMLKARTGEVYWGCYRSDAGGVREQQPERVGTVAAAAEGMPAGTMVGGEGWTANRDEFRRLLHERTDIREAAPGLMTASAVAIGVLGAERLARGERAGTTVTPRYIQRPEAEVRWEARHAAQAAPAGDRG